MNPEQSLCRTLLLVLTLSAAACKASKQKTDSEVETLRATKQIGTGDKIINQYLYSWATRISAGGAGADLCWYYKEVPQQDKPLSLRDALASAVRINTSSVDNKHIKNELNLKIARKNFDLGVSTTGRSNCVAAVGQTGVILTVPVVTGGFAGVAAANIAMCAWSIYGTIDASLKIRSALTAEAVARFAHVGARMTETDSSAIDDLREAILKSRKSWNSGTDQTCPASSTLIQFLERNGFKFPGVG